MIDGKNQIVGIYNIDKKETVIFNYSQGTWLFVRILITVSIVIFLFNFLFQ
jgi:hypothetical protein